MTRCVSLLTPEETKPDGDGSCLSPAVGQELGRAEDAVYGVGIAIVGEIVHAQAPRPQVMESTELPFEGEVHVEVIRQTVRARTAHEKAVFRSDIEWKAASVFD